MKKGRVSALPATSMLQGLERNIDTYLICIVGKSLGSTHKITICNTVRSMYTWKRVWERRWRRREVACIDPPWPLFESPDPGRPKADWGWPQRCCHRACWSPSGSGCPRACNGYRQVSLGSTTSVSSVANKQKRKYSQLSNKSTVGNKSTATLKFLFQAIVRSNKSTAIQNVITGTIVVLFYFGILIFWYFGTLGPMESILDHAD